MGTLPPVSIIRLREMIRHRGRRATAILVVALAVLVAAHHAGPHDSQADSAGHLVAVAAEHGPQVPASAVDDIVAVCLAILPVAAALIALLGVVLTLGRRLRPPAGRLTQLSLEPATGPPRRARTGPRLLCVMRC